MPDSSPPASAQQPADPGGGRVRRRMAVVVNPMKVDDLDAAQTLLSQVCRRDGWQETT